MGPGYANRIRGLEGRMQGVTDPQQLARMQARQQYMQGQAQNFRAGRANPSTGGPSFTPSGDANSALRDALRSGMQGMGMQPMPRGGQGWGNSLEALQGAAMAAPQGANVSGILGGMAGQMQGQAQGQGYPAQPPMRTDRQWFNWLNTADSKRPAMVERSPQQNLPMQGANALASAYANAVPLRRY